MLEEVLARFEAHAALSVMMRLALEQAMPARWIDEVFEATRQRQYPRELLFSTVVKLTSLVSLGLRPSLHAAAKKEKPTHYKVVCISLYNEDIERLKGLVAELKRRGHTKANQSQVIRAALDQIDLEKVPKGY